MEVDGSPDGVPTVGIFDDRETVVGGLTSVGDSERIGARRRRLTRDGTGKAALGPSWELVDEGKPGVATTQRTTKTNQSNGSRPLRAYLLGRSNS